MALYFSAWVIGRVVTYFGGGIDESAETKTALGGVIIACLILILGVLFALVRFVHWAWTF